MTGPDITPEVRAKYFHLVIQGKVRDWLVKLPPRSVNTWEDLKDEFVKRFQTEDMRKLKQCVQKEGETTRDWAKRIAEILDSAKSPTVQSAIQVMKKNCRFEPLVHNLNRAAHKIDSFDKLWATVDKYTETEKIVSDSPQIPKEEQQAAQTEHRASQPKGQGRCKELLPNSIKGVLDIPCDLHRRRDGRPASHTKAQCHYYRRWREGHAPGATHTGPMQQKDKASPHQDPEALPRRNVMQFHTVEVRTARNDRKRVHDPTPERYCRWTEQSVIWSRGDHPPEVRNPGQPALVVAPQVAGYRLHKVLMDGGGRVNILYQDTLRRMNIPESRL